jgi:hypothetical protein
VHGHAVAATGAAVLAHHARPGREELDVVALVLAELSYLVEHLDPFHDLFPVLPTGMIPILSAVETPDFFELEVPGPGSPEPGGPPAPAPGGLWAAGERITWVAGLVLALSSFMDWYAGSGVGVKLAVIGWHTGVLGKLVFFIGLAVVLIVALREAGFELPPNVPESLVVLALGALATIFVLIRVISIPDAVLPADGRGIGIWISLLAGLGLIAGGLLRAAEEF